MGAPANSIDTPEGFDASDPGAIFEQLPIDGGDDFDVLQTVEALIAPLLEQDLLSCRSRTRLQLIDYPYGLVEPTEEAELTCHTRMQATLGEVLQGGPGAMDLAGESAGLLYGRQFFAEAGSLAVTGGVAGSIRSYRLPAQSGTTSASGQATGLLYQRQPLAASPASLSLAGSPVSFFKGAAMPASGGTLALAGQAAQLERSAQLAGAAGAMALAGQAAAFRLDDYFSSWATQTYDFQALPLPEWWAD